jgi:hypothetical protein
MGHGGLGHASPVIDDDYKKGILMDGRQVLAMVEATKLTS